MMQTAGRMLSALGHTHPVPTSVSSSARSPLLLRRWHCVHGRSALYTPQVTRYESPMRTREMRKAWPGNANEAYFYLCRQRCAYATENIGAQQNSEIDKQGVQSKIQQQVSHGLQTYICSCMLEYLTQGSVMVQVVTGWNKFVKGAIGGAALLSVLLSTAAPPAALAEPWFSNNKPSLQEMKVTPVPVPCKIATSRLHFETITAPL